MSTHKLLWVQVYSIVDEMFLAGELRETSQTKVWNNADAFNNSILFCHVRFWSSYSCWTPSNEVLCLWDRNQWNMLWWIQETRSFDQVPWVWMWWNNIWNSSKHWGQQNIICTAKIKWIILWFFSEPNVLFDCQPVHIWNIIKWILHEKDLWHV